jgi:Rrf2 family protein
LAAIAVMLDVAFHGGRTATVSATEIAERAGTARRGMEPLLQSLSRAGLLESVRGPRGGYRLGRPRRDISLADIIAVSFEEGVDPNEPPPGKLQEVVLDPLWKELSATLDERLAAITLDDLMRRAAQAGLRRPMTEPISYAI